MSDPPVVARHYSAAPCLGQDGQAASADAVLQRLWGYVFEPASRSARVTTPDLVAAQREQAADVARSGLSAAARDAICACLAGR